VGKMKRGTERRSEAADVRGLGNSDVNGKRPNQERSCVESSSSIEDYLDAKCVTIVFSRGTRHVELVETFLSVLSEYLAHSFIKARKEN
jgi:hypothetical protein